MEIANYVKLRNLCFTLLRKSKRDLFGSLNEKDLCDKKKFWGVVMPLLSNKVVSNEKITLVERMATLQKPLKTLHLFSMNFFLIP